MWEFCPGFVIVDTVYYRHENKPKTKETKIMKTLTTTNNKKSFMIQNPVMKRLSKVTEESSDHVTYKGVAKKCGFFVLMIIAGVVLTFLANFFFGTPDSTSSDYPLPIMILMGIAALSTLITPFIAIFAKKCTAVAGSIFCASIGVIYTSSAIFIDGCRNEILLALIVTVALFVALALLFSMNKIQVNHKFRSTAYIALAVLVVASILLVVTSFIPALNGPVTALLSNPVLCIGFSILGVVLASMFVLMDLQNVKNAVDNHVPKSYEWSCAFGIVFSVIWLFVEVIQLVSNVKN